MDEIVTKGLRNRSLKGHIKSNKEPNLIVALSLPRNTLSILSSQISQITTHTPASHKKWPFFLKGRMKKELLDHLVNAPLASIANTKHLQNRAPHNLYILSVPKEMIKVFLSSKRQKGPTSEVLLTNLLTMFTQPSKTCQIKN